MIHFATTLYTKNIQSLSLFSHKIDYLTQQFYVKYYNQGSSKVPYARGANSKNIQNSRVGQKPNGFNVQFLANRGRGPIFQNTLHLHLT
jgi:hypothetical protein